MHLVTSFDYKTTLQEDSSFIPSVKKRVMKYSHPPSCEGFELMLPPSLSQTGLSQTEGSYLVQAQHASHFESDQKVQHAMKMMKKEDFIPMGAEKMALIFDAFQLTVQEETSLLQNIFCDLSFKSCRDVLMNSRPVSPAQEPSEEEQDAAISAENSILLKGIQTSASAISTIMSSPFTLFNRLVIGKEQNE